MSHRDCKPLSLWKHFFSKIRGALGCKHSISAFTVHMTFCEGSLFSCSLSLSCIYKVATLHDEIVTALRGIMRRSSVRSCPWSRHRSGLAQTILSSSCLLPPWQSFAQFYWRIATTESSLLSCQGLLVDAYDNLPNKWARESICLQYYVYAAVRRNGTWLVRLSGLVNLNNSK